jgi:hypothetical protein
MLAVVGKSEDTDRLAVSVVLLACSARHRDGDDVCIVFSFFLLYLLVCTSVGRC